MDYIKKADISFYGVDDELKNDPNSIFTTNINSSQTYLTYHISVSGPDVNVGLVENDNEYNFIAFKQSGVLTLTKELVCDILIVGGGGGGGYFNGGGGAGAVLYTRDLLIPSGTYLIVVGDGGLGGEDDNSNGNNGSDSSITINSTTYTAKGGGGGGTRNTNLVGRAGNDGGSGGGGSHSNTSTAINVGGSSTKNTYTGWTSLGNGGGAGKDGTATGHGSGGGGGAGSAGNNAGANSGGHGGRGVNLIFIFGNTVGHSGWFGGGGGGGSYQSGSIGYGNGGNGLLGGGGRAYRVNGLANTGGGGGGGAFGSGGGAGGKGGSGVVILRYKKSNITNRTNLLPDKTIDGISFLQEAVPSTFIKKNTKRFKFTLNSSIKQLSLSSKAKLVIESISIPNVLSKSFLQSKAVNNIILKMKGLLNDNIYDSSTKGTGSSVIFSVPIKFNSQGYGLTYEASLQPDLISASQKPRLNTDNNGYLFINPEPEVLYNFDINQAFIDDGEVEFTLVYDIGNVWKKDTNANVYINKPETLDFETDKNDLEGFNINFIIKDYDDSNNLIYSEKGLLNSINRIPF